MLKKGMKFQLNLPYRRNNLSKTDREIKENAPIKRIMGEFPGYMVLELRAFLVFPQCYRVLS